MQRRKFFAAAIAGLAAWRGAGLARADEGGAAKVVYHLSDYEKVIFVLGNIENHIKGVGGPDKVRIALVVHGPALKAFRASAATPDVASAIGGFSKAGLELAACANTMRGMKLTLGDLLPGFVSAERGGVVRIAELQAQGYAYLRP
jgi:intracellular sulfur oxidation DsrE/DsrF family protein